MTLVEGARDLPVDNCFCCYKFAVADGSAHRTESASMEGSELIVTNPFLPDGYFLLYSVVSLELPSYRQLIKSNKNIKAIFVTGRGGL
jgi:hypothetical protein